MNTAKQNRRSRDAGCWMLDARCWSSAIGYWMLDVGCWMLDVPGSRFEVQGSRFKVQGLPQQTAKNARNFACAALPDSLSSPRSFAAIVSRVAPTPARWMLDVGCWMLDVPGS